MFLCSFTGQVLTASLDTITLSVKDKNGVPTGQTKDHRVVKIQLLVTLSDKSMRAINVSSFDPAVDFVLPKVGDKWDTGEIKKLEYDNGFPVVSI